MDADELYGLPLERFVPERDALAKALRAQGRREDAARVAKLRKPSVAAWAVNQLVRTQGRALNELLESGDGLTAAHAAVISGSGDGRTLREAAERERAAVAALVETARGLLTSDGHELSPSIIDRVADTLHAAALEDEAREQVRHGRLERELRHVGLGAGGLVLAAGPPSSTRAPAPAAPKAKAKKPEPELAAARKAARAAEVEARRRSERAARALNAAQQNRDRAAAQLEQAERALAAAQAEAEAAAEAHRQASEKLDR